VIYGIAPFMPPELVAILMEMGHGDDLILCDRNYPASKYGSRVIRCDSLSIPTLLDEILRLIPIDYITDYTVTSMCPPPDVIPPIWVEYEKIIKARVLPEAKLAPIPRQEFYERGKQTYVSIKTGEVAKFANIIIRKGVYQEDVPGATL